MATKSTSTSPVGFTVMSLIILVMAALFSAKNGASALALESAVVQMVRGRRRHVMGNKRGGAAGQTDRVVIAPSAVK